MGMKLYKKDTSAPCRSVYMVLEILKIPDVEYINMNLKERDHFTEEYLKVQIIQSGPEEHYSRLANLYNEMHSVSDEPTAYDTNVKDGDFVIWDSHAITTYLVNQYSKDDSLYPKDPKKRAIVDQRLHFDNAILFASLRETMVPVLYDGEKTLRPENLAKIKAGYDFIEKFFTGPWLAGDSITLADICCVANISSLNEVLPIDKIMYPNLTAWFERCAKQEFYIKANAPGLRSFQELLKSVFG